MAVRITVKWGKKKFDDVEIDTAGPPDGLRAALEALTGVPAEKQKLLCKKGWKGTLSAKSSLAGVPDGAVVTLIGTASRLARATEEVRFVEDLPKSELASAGAVLPAGLGNRENICYLNATLQCLRAVPPLDAAVRDVAAGRLTVPGDGAGAVVRGLGEVLSRVAASTEHEPVYPSALLGPVRAVHPIFGERDRTGTPLQQDSDEFQSQLLSDLASCLVTAPAGGVAELAPALGGSDRRPNLVETLLGVELRTTLTCAEGEGAEPPSERREALLKLRCNIQGGGGSTTKVNHMSEGMRLALEGTVEKRSEALGRDALFARSSRVSRLPPFLCVQFMRFYWRANPDAKAGEPQGTKYKIKRSVAFPLDGLDLFEYCHTDLQAALGANRSKHAREEEARRAARDAAASSSSSSSSSSDPPAKRAKETGGDAADDDELASAVEASAASPGGAASASSSSSSGVTAEAAAAVAGYGLPDEFEGVYELFAVVSHAGPTADSGHYTGWVRRGEPGSGSTDWLNFDDETVSPCKAEHVAELKGSGSDTGDIAYMAFYRAVK